MHAQRRAQPSRAQRRVRTHICVGPCQQTFYPSYGDQDTTSAEGNSLLSHPLTSTRFPLPRPVWVPSILSLYFVHSQVVTYRFQNVAVPAPFFFLPLGGRILLVCFFNLGSQFDCTVHVSRKSTGSCEGRSVARLFASHPQTGSRGL